MNIVDMKAFGEKPNVLVVDDEEDIRALFCTKLLKSGYCADQASTVEEALAAVSSRKYSAVLLDLFLGETNSLDRMADFFANAPTTKIVILTGHGSIDFAVNAMNKGASGFLVKTDLADKNIEKFKALISKPEFGRESQSGTLSDLGIIGKSGAIAEVALKLRKLRSIDSTVLLQGESGTGKELFARAIHNISDRSSGPFIAINCAAISENILESELFGYKRGAFTDARTDRKGYFETCTNGTLFLDEIGEMSPGLQSKLLRVLQEKEVTPLGSCSPVAVNTRIVAATNRNLHEDIKAKNFRQDLYYRIAVFEIMLPPLRKRKGDIPALLEHFVKHYNERFNKTVTSNTSVGLYNRLVAYDWPGNVRELQNSVERAVALSDSDQIRVEDLLPHSEWRDPAGDDASPKLEELPLNFQAAKESFEAFYIKNLLSSTYGNVTEAAKLSGQYRPNVYRLIKKYKLDPHQFKNEIFS